MDRDIFSLVEENPPIAGCTISRKLFENEEMYGLIFSLGEGTGISETSYGGRHLFYLLSGRLTIRQGKDFHLSAGDFYLSAPKEALAVRAETDAVYMEIGFIKEDITMNQIQEKEIFALKDLVPYSKGRIINRSLIETDKVHFAVISLAAGTSLAEHAAPRDALLFGLDGEGFVTREGKTFTLKAGENLAMKKGDRHSLKAGNDFKFALLLTEE